MAKLRPARVGETPVPDNYAVEDNHYVWVVEDDCENVSGHSAFRVEGDKLLCEYFAGEELRQQLDNVLRVAAKFEIQPSFSVSLEDRKVLEFFKGLKYVAKLAKDRVQFTPVE